MSPEAAIVDCGPFCAVGFLRTIDKSEFSHSLDRLQSFKMMPTRGRASKNGELEETRLSRLEVWEESSLGKSTLSEVRKYSTENWRYPRSESAVPIRRIIR